MIALIDYGAGNLTSVRKALAHLDAAVTTPTIPSDLNSVSGIIVPGVGNFKVTNALGPDWRAAIETHVARQRPLLGICVGMQWLFEGSSEAPGHPGLKLLPGLCRRLTGEPGPSQPGVDNSVTNPAQNRTARLKVPHVGWNSLHLTGRSWLLEDIDEGDQVYFTHSYAAPVTSSCVGATKYGVEFAAAVEQGQIAGVQFHPEKSSDVGLRILANFLRRIS